MTLVVTLKNIVAQKLNILSASDEYQSPSPTTMASVPTTTIQDSPVAVGTDTANAFRQIELWADQTEKYLGIAPGAPGTAQDVPIGGIVGVLHGPPANVSIIGNGASQTVTVMTFTAAVVKGHQYMFTGYGVGTEGGAGTSAFSNCFVSDSMSLLNVGAGVVFYLFSTQALIASQNAMSGNWVIAPTITGNDVFTMHIALDAANTCSWAVNANDAQMSLIRVA